MERFGAQRETKEDQTRESTIAEIIPIRCVTCRKVLGHMGNRIDELRRKNFTNEEIFEELGLDRWCCRNAVFNPVKVSMAEYLDENIPTYKLLEKSVQEIREEAEQEEENTNPTTGVKTGAITGAKKKSGISDIKARLAKLSDAKKEKEETGTTRVLKVKKIIAT
jgi:DNA-directed RNA polymerase I, II, and III subunit RPABC5